MPNNQNGKQSGGNQMDTLDIQINIIIPGVKLKVYQLTMNTVLLSTCSSIG